MVAKRMRVWEASWYRRP